jgi:hypothetical protein
MESFELKAGVIAMACAAVPASAFNAAMQREALTKFEYFPSAAEVFGLFKADVEVMAARRRALIVAATSTPPVPPFSSSTMKPRSRGASSPQ